MNKMQIIVDSGSTKSDWAIVNGADAIRFQTEGINPLMQSAESIREMLEKSYGGWEICEGSEMHFYGAGCVGERAKEVVRDALSQLIRYEDIEIASDLLGAARALCGHEAGIACILGTGANSCYYDGENIEANTHPLGYILGDEGSGAYIGKKIVSDALKGLMDDELTEKFWQWAGMSYEEIIEHVYRLPYPNRFLAGFTRFAAENIDNDVVRSIIRDAFVSFIDRNLMQYERVGQVGIGYVGSVAIVFEEILADVMRERGLKMGKMLKTPISGLIEWHREMSE